jgi:hypothetical protein
VAALRELRAAEVAERAGGIPWGLRSTQRQSFLLQRALRRPASFQA